MTLEIPPEYWEGSWKALLAGLGVLVSGDSIEAAR